MTISVNNRSKALSLVAQHMKSNITKNITKSNKHTQKGIELEAKVYNELTDPNINGFFSPKLDFQKRMAKESIILGQRGLRNAALNAQTLKNLRSVNRTTRDYLNNVNLNQKNVLTKNGPRSIGYIRTISNAQRSGLNFGILQNITKRAKKKERGGLNLVSDTDIKKMKVNELTNREYNALRRRLEERVANRNIWHVEKNYKLYNSNNLTNAHKKLIQGRRRHTPLNMKLFDFKTMSRKNLNTLLDVLDSERVQEQYTEDEILKAKQDVLFLWLRDSPFANFDMNL